jgi:hypothetical protein
MTKKPILGIGLLFLLLWMSVPMAAADGSGSSCPDGSCSIENHQSGNAQQQPEVADS